MKSTSEVLKALNIQKNATNNKIANHYLNLLKLVNELKNDIAEVNVLDFNAIESKYFDRWNNKISGENYYKIFNSEFLKTVQIITSFGSYEITAPTDTNFYSYLCVLLKIEYTHKKETENLTFENSIYIDNGVNDSILKASKFTNLKSFNQIAHNVILKIENGFVEVLASTGFVVYKSQKFNFISDQKIDSLFLSIPVNEVSIFKSNKNEFLKIDIINNLTILVNDQIIHLSNVDTTAINDFNFDLNDLMEFEKINLIKNIRSLKSFLDYTNRIKFHLNGCIDMQVNNKIAGLSTNLKTEYITKNFVDSDYIFTYNDIYNTIASFKTKNLLFSPTIQKNKTMAIITDKIDSFLIVSQDQK